MFPSRGKPPPLSPVLLAGLMARPLPPQLLQPVLDAVFAVLTRRHPGLFERLSCLNEPVFLIDPIDLPLVFLLDANPDHPRLTAARESDGRATAVIRGPLLKLIDLLEGRVAEGALAAEEAQARFQTEIGDVAFCNGYINNSIGCAYR